MKQQVTNQVLDLGLLAQTAEPARKIFDVEAITVVTDKDYYKIEDVEACENTEITPYIPRPQRGPSVRAGLFRKDEFSYDAASNTYVCPAGQRLHAYTSSLQRGLERLTQRRSWVGRSPSEWDGQAVGS